MSSRNKTRATGKISRKYRDRAQRGGKEVSPNIAKSEDVNSGKKQSLVNGGREKKERCLYLQHLQM